MKTRILAAILCLLAYPAVAQSAGSAMPFYPLGNAALAVTATTGASTAVALTQLEEPTGQVMIVNDGSGEAFCAFGGSTVAATTSNIPIPAAVVEVFTLNEGQQYVSCITAASSTTVKFVGGRGD